MCTYMVNWVHLYKKWWNLVDTTGWDLMKSGWGGSLDNITYTHVYMDNWLHITHPSQEAQVGCYWAALDKVNIISARFY